jgi:hypothetical protein
MEQNLSSEQLQEQITKLEEEARKINIQLAALRSQQFVEALSKADGPLPRENRTVTRAKNGLTVNGSRLTLYHIMDEMKENNPLKNVRDIYELTDEEMLDVLDYIHLNKNEVEKEYQEILKSSEQDRKYWEEKNQERMEKNYPQREAVLAKLREWQEQYRAEHKA